MTCYLPDPPPPAAVDTRDEADHYWAAVEDTNDERRDQRIVAADAGFVSSGESSWAVGFWPWLAEEMATW